MASEIGQVVIPAGTRGVLDVLADEYDKLADAQDVLREAARRAGRAGAAVLHKSSSAAYRHCAAMARVVLPGGVPDGR